MFGHDLFTVLDVDTVNALALQIADVYGVHDLAVTLCAVGVGVPCRFGTFALHTNLVKRYT